MKKVLDGFVRTCGNPHTRSCRNQINDYSGPHVRLTCARRSLNEKVRVIEAPCDRFDQRRVNVRAMERSTARMTDNTRKAPQKDVLRRAVGLPVETSIDDARCQAS